MTDEPGHSLTHPCPDCGQPVEIPPEPTGSPLQCNACGQQFIIDDEIEEADVEVAGVSGEQELDAMRIERISKLRIALYRSRSHAVIATIVCAVGAIQLIILISHELRMPRWGWRIALYALLFVPAIYGIWFFARSARALHLQARSDQPTS